jgi:ribosomal protein S18 acetylase RimI-like enzyme
MEQFPLNNPTEFRLRPVGLADLEQTAALCDACVGKNLYPKAKIQAAIKDEDHLFYLLQDPAGETVGYIYFYLTELAHIARDAKIHPNLLPPFCSDLQERMGKLQSVAVREDHRGKGLAVQMVQFALEQLRRRNASAVFSVCWKMGQVVPLEKTLQDCGFSFLTEAEKVWFHEEALFCPYCNGRCHCNAEIYYKKLI